MKAVLRYNSGGSWGAVASIPFTSSSGPVVLYCLSLMRLSEPWRSLLATFCSQPPYQVHEEEGRGVNSRAFWLSRVFQSSGRGVTFQALGLGSLAEMPE